MSFIDLWDCFAEVRENWNENRQLLEAFLDVSKILIEIEKKHCEKLDKLCTHPFFKMGKNTLVPTIEKFQKFYMVKLLNSKNFVTMLQTNLIHPIKELMINQEIMIKEKIENYRKLEMEKKKIEKQCEISKEKY